VLGERGKVMRTRRATGLLVTVAMAVALSGCGGDDSKASSAAFEAADKYEITQLQVKWHEALTTKNLDQAMSLFADDAVFTVGGQTYSGKEQIQNWLATKAAAFKPENRWTSLHPAFKLRVSAVDDRGTLHFECHFVDPETQQFKASLQGDARVARISGRWLFTSVAGGNATLTV
jgi:uncharacterized protein (TIGR02246 family)